MIDLHIHTKHSDGTDSAIELLQSAQKSSLDVISITDHNNVGAYQELQGINIRELFDGKIIPGIELNTKILNVPIEILGYGIDFRMMSQLVKDMYVPEEERNRLEAERLYEKCMEAGIKLDKDCLERYDLNGFASKFIHNEIQKHDENKGILGDCVDSKSFYRKFMSNPEGPLYIEMDDLVPDFATAFNLIKSCGGLVFIPHIFEYRENAGKILKFILDNYKIDGIECFYTTFSEEQTRKLINICKQYNIYMSGGSDYHGSTRSNVHLGKGYGNLNIDDSIIASWSEKVPMFKQ